MTSLCPVATRSATTQQISSVNESPWDGSSVLIKVGVTTLVGMATLLYVGCVWSLVR